VWLSGVRRVGKTVLCQSLPRIDYFDCELPRVRRQMEDPEAFLNGLRGKRVVLDEIHRLNDPAELLKIAADHYPSIKVLATGSSTLGASSKFRDTLTGRKAEVWMTPMLLPDLSDFRIASLEHRLLRGGLPPFCLARELPEALFQEWMDAYWAKDIQELFRLERRQSFLQCLELLLRQSGGIFEATSFARPCEVSRGTIMNYLGVLEATYLIHVLRPFSSRRPAEIVSAPKVYAFDTGFVCYFRGWGALRPEDKGLLWEHLVLNEIQGQLQTRLIGYWRDKRGHEVDFILARRGRPPIAIECKWSAAEIDPAGMQAFHRQYPQAECLLVAQDVDRSYQRTYGDLRLTVLSLAELVRYLVERRGGKPKVQPVKLRKGPARLADAVVEDSG